MDSRCGVSCAECEHFGGDCGGCLKTEGKPFWLRYILSDVCQIYKCCVGRGYVDCGRCAELPCEMYLTGDPSRSFEENESILKNQLENLRKANES